MKYLLIKAALLAIILSATVVISNSCTCSTCGKNEEAVVPLDVMNNADSFIISKTGKDVFDKFITPDFYRTKHTAPYYEMVYRFYIPDKPYVDALIKLTVDSLGNPVLERDVIGIPNCRFYPEQCNFNIDEQQARQIAEDNGLEKGIKDWKVGFIWNPQRERYIWHVLNTISEMEGEIGYRGSGKEIIIDPVTGDVLALNDWNIR